SSLRRVGSIARMLLCFHPRSDATDTERESQSMPELPDDLRSLQDAFGVNERSAHALIAGLTEEAGTWQMTPGSWSGAQCLDHLATGNRVYVAAWEAPAARARAAGRIRRGPARPGLVGGWFVKSLEPPVTRKMRAPAKSVPRSSPPLADAAAAFFASHDQIVEFLRRYADIDLAG